MADTRPRPSSSNEKTRHFFKLMLGDFQKKLRIPDAFIKLISKELSGRAVLEGPSGNCWQVKLSYTETGTYFTDGWETFQRDHSLAFAEFLLFKYTSDMNFQVLIFGINGCERRDTFVVEPSQLLSFGQLKRCQSFRQDKGKLMSLPRPVKHILPEQETPQFPFFKRKMAVSYVRIPFSMYIPAKFARDHLPRNTTMVRLQNKKGKTWKVKLRVGPIQTTFRRGWMKFIKDNRLKVGDSCRFQLVGKAVMKVKIYRC